MELIIELVLLKRLVKLLYLKLSIKISNHQDASPSDLVFKIISFFELVSS